jgi:flagellin-like hook-associated protein FlgL
MIRSYSAITELFLSNLSASQKRSATATEQISSGYRVSTDSDSPDDVVTIMDLETRISHASQVLENLTNAEAETDCSESARETAITLLDQVDVIGVQALGVSGTTGSRESLATQVQQLLEQMVGLTQLYVNGKYVFSGDNDQNIQYTVDETNTEIGATQNFTAEQTTQVLDIFGGSFKPAMTAAEMFDARDSSGAVTEDNVFAAVEMLYQGLMDTDTTTGTATINAAVTAIQSAQTWLNNCLSFYGSVQNRMSQSETMATQYSTMWTTQLGAVRDTDVAAAATELESATTQQEAAMSAYTALSQNTLFDYIK